MFSLVLTVCLMTAPQTCREERAPTEARLSMECMQAMTEWASQHPWLRVTRWACRRVDRAA